MNIEVEKQQQLKREERGRIIMRTLAIYELENGILKVVFERTNSIELKETIKDLESKNYKLKECLIGSVRLLLPKATVAKVAQLESYQKVHKEFIEKLESYKCDKLTLEQVKECNSEEEENVKKEIAYLYAQCLQLNTRVLNMKARVIYERSIPNYCENTNKERKRKAKTILV